jgi:hypothetical protein
MAADRNKREADELAMSSRAVNPIPIFGGAADEKLKAITKTFELPIKLNLHQKLVDIYFDHKDLWLKRQGSREFKRSAAKINTATRKYMSVLNADSAFVQLLCDPMASPNDSTFPIEDINTLGRLLRRLAFNSNAAIRAKAARGRGKDQRAVTVAEKLGRLYDRHQPPSSRRMPRGVSRSDIRNAFINDMLNLLGLDLTEESIRTYREKKHRRRIRP